MIDNLLVRQNKLKLKIFFRLNYLKDHHKTLYKIKKKASSHALSGNLVLIYPNWATFFYFWICPTFWKLQSPNTKKIKEFRFKLFDILEIKECQRNYFGIGLFLKWKKVIFDNKMILWLSHYDNCKIVSYMKFL